MMGGCGEPMMPSTSIFSANALSKAVFATLVTHIIKITAHKKKKRKHFIGISTLKMHLLLSTSVVQGFLKFEGFQEHHLFQILPNRGSFFFHFLHFRKSKELNGNYFHKM